MRLNTKKEKTSFNSTNTIYNGLKQEHFTSTFCCCFDVGSKTDSQSVPVNRTLDYNRTNLASHNYFILRSPKNMTTYYKRWRMYVNYS